jgi:putative (di)nucleoside polyphosphate hydrolase
VRRGEPVDDALFRELNEEIGLKPQDVHIVARTRGWLRYRLPMPFIRRDSTPLCVGQKQRWYLLRLRAAEGQLRFDATDQPPEFDRWRWVDYWEPIREVIYFKRHVYSRALHELGDLAFPRGLPPYPDWWTEKVAARSGPRAPRGRSRGPARSTPAS